MLIWPDWTTAEWERRLAELHALDAKKTQHAEKTQTRRAGVIYLDEKFDPDQPRDENGRWSDTGAGSSTKPSTVGTSSGSPASTPSISTASEGPISAALRKKQEPYSLADHYSPDAGFYACWMLRDGKVVDTLGQEHFEVLPFGTHDKQVAEENLVRIRMLPPILESRADLYVQTFSPLSDGQKHELRRLVQKAEPNITYEYFNTELGYSEISGHTQSATTMFNRLEGKRIVVYLDQKEWDEDKHPRAPAGSSEGGQFTSAGNGSGGGTVSGTTHFSETATAPAPAASTSTSPSTGSIPSSFATPAPPTPSTNPATEATRAKYNQIFDPALTGNPALSAKQNAQIHSRVANAIDMMANDDPRLAIPLRKVQVADVTRTDISSGLTVYVEGSYKPKDGTLTLAPEMSASTVVHEYAHHIEHSLFEDPVPGSSVPTHMIPLTEEGHHLYNVSRQEYTAAVKVGVDIINEELARQGRPLMEWPPPANHSLGRGAIHYLKGQQRRLPAVSSYSLRTHHEWFAEAYMQYHLNPGNRTKLATKMPKTYELMKKLTSGKLFA